MRCILTPILNVGEVVACILVTGREFYMQILAFRAVPTFPFLEEVTDLLCPVRGRGFWCSGCLFAESRWLVCRGDIQRHRTEDSTEVLHVEIEFSELRVKVRASYERNSLAVVGVGL